MNIVVVGSGVFGYAISLNIWKNKHHVTILCSNKEKADKLKTHELEIIKGNLIPDDINITNKYEVIQNADIIFVMTSIKYFKKTIEKISKYFNKKQIICVGTKGVSESSPFFIHKIIKNTLKAKNYGILMGPTLADNLINFEPAAFSLACSNQKSMVNIKKSLENSNLKIEICHDINGLEIWSSIKNTIAISSGIIDGLNFHNSTKALLITDAIKELINISKSFGGKTNTILRYGGIGDLILTSTTNKSRNYNYGVLIGQKDYAKAQKYLDENTVEGYYTLKAIYPLIKQKKIKTPIIDAIYKIIIKKANPEILVNLLITEKR